MTTAQVRLWGDLVGVVLQEDPHAPAVFQYHPHFVERGIEVSPLAMPLGPQPYVFASLSHATFRGLPGLLADSLPDRFGNALIDTWLATQGRGPEDFDAVERLCYIGARGMGGLEFAPPTGPSPRESEDLDVSALVALASDVLTRRHQVVASHRVREDALRSILTVGTSAGGARAKAIIAWNPETNAVRSGQVPAGEGFEHWLLKFDGVRGNRDKELEDPRGYGAVEYAYAKMAVGAGIEMTECRLLEENGRRHFMTRRFDRPGGDMKLHLQSLGGLAHYDFNRPGDHSYEEALLTIRHLGLSMAAVEEQYRRMVFNLVARNQDDHVKNIAFLMDPSGQWALAPAFDVTFAYSPTGRWTNRHQMSVNTKRENFTIEDLRACAQSASMSKNRADSIVDQVLEAVGQWRTFAQQASLPEPLVEAIQHHHHLDL